MSPESVMAVRTAGLGKRYGAMWALSDCTLSVPQGRVSALVGPNGAGKTTLLKSLAALSIPSAGDAQVLGRAPGQSEEFLDSVGYLAQDIPLYKRLTAQDHLSLGAELNRNWDADGARARVAAQQIPADRPVATLSGGQRAKLALILAIAKRPRLLLLDEPVAALDPLARREFLTSLTEAVADGGVSVVMSSHLLLDLERVCDHVILLAAARVQLCSDIEELLATHRMVVGPRRELGRIHGFTIIRATQTERQTRLLVRTEGPMLDPSWVVSEVGLEDIVLAYMGADDAMRAGPLASVGEGR